MSTPSAAPDHAAACTDITVMSHDGLRLHVCCYGARAATVPAECVEPPAGEERQRRAIPLPVICLAGLTRTANDFDALARGLAYGTAHLRRILALDYRGRGKSDYDPNPANYSLPVETADVVTVLKALDAEPAILVGTSRGGLIAMLLAATQPAAIAGVVLNDIGPAIEPTGLQRIQRYIGKTHEPESYTAAAEILRASLVDQFPNLTEADWLAAAHRGYNQENGRLLPTYDKAVARSLDTFKPGAPLPTLWNEFDALASTPLMVVRGANSDILSSATVEAMRVRHPALEIVEIPDQGHAPLLAEHEIIARIADFAARCDAAFA